eukprot:scaffold344_cov130-Cylindrotheca_fusiformis.AAC.2
MKSGIYLRCARATAFSIGKATHLLPPNTSKFQSYFLFWLYFILTTVSHHTLNNIGMTTPLSDANYDLPIDRDTLFAFLETGNGPSDAVDANTFSSGWNDACSTLTLSEALDHPVTEDILEPSYNQNCNSDSKNRRSRVNAQEELVPISYFQDRPETSARGAQNAATTAAAAAAKPSQDAQSSHSSTDLAFAQSLHELLSAGMHHGAGQSRTPICSPSDNSGTSKHQPSLSFDQSSFEQNEPRQVMDSSYQEYGDDELSIAYARKYDDEKWNEYLQELLAFKTKWGHCCVPYRYKPNPALSRWVRRQRYQYKLKQDGKPGGITDCRVSTLENVGFAWSAHGQKWQKRFNELMAYCFENGHGNVPHNYDKNPELANWVKNQRRQHKLFQEGKPSNITQGRIDALNSLGFTWEHR